MLLANTIINVLPDFRQRSGRSCHSHSGTSGRPRGRYPSDRDRSFNFGDGFCNFVLPTSTALMGIISAVNIPLTVG